MGEAAGGYESQGAGFAVKSDGRVAAWGRPYEVHGYWSMRYINGNYEQYWYEYTNGWDTVSTMPANLTNVVKVAVGGECALALKADGSVVSWGWSRNYGRGYDVPDSDCDTICDAEEVAYGRDPLGWEDWHRSTVGGTVSIDLGPVVGAVAYLDMWPVDMDAVGTIDIGEVPASHSVAASHTITLKHLDVGAAVPSPVGVIGREGERVQVEVATDGPRGSLVVTATPGAAYTSAIWSGDIEGAVPDGLRITVPVDWPKDISISFTALGIGLTKWASTAMVATSL